MARLRRVVARLVDAHEEASDAAKRGLEFRGGAEEDEGEPSAANAHLEDALVDVLDTLEGAAADVRRILRNTAEEQGE